MSEFPQEDEALETDIVITPGMRFYLDGVVNGTLVSWKLEKLVLRFDGSDGDTAYTDPETIGSLMGQMTGPKTLSEEDRYLNS